MKFLTLITVVALAQGLHGILKSSYFLILLNIQTKLCNQKLSIGMETIGH